MLTDVADLSIALIAATLALRRVDGLSAVQDGGYACLGRLSG
jgi:hypothetical protein